MKNEKNNGRMLFGGVLVIIGILFLLDNYGILMFELPDFIFEWEWILILLGTFLLVTSNNKTAGSILLAIGIFNLFPAMWPLILVIIGVYLLMRKTPSHFHSDKSVNENDVIDEVSIFGGGTKIITSPNFKGGRITAIFGGSEIKFIDAKLAEGHHVLDVFALFGGTTIYVPKDWNVKVNITPILGGFGDKRYIDPNEVFDPDRVLIIKGIMLFGGGEIKSF
ncbi:MAG: hypothetical protein D6830_01620 [Ignavibacteria bacterium]|nr:MAG: hypothetical protein D6830_01620 [Ignavibacteria bacterium]